MEKILVSPGVSSGERVNIVILHIDLSQGYTINQQKDWKKSCSRSKRSIAFLKGTLTVVTLVLHCLVDWPKLLNHQLALAMKQNLNLEWPLLFLNAMTAEDPGVSVECYGRAV